MRTTEPKRFRRRPATILVVWGPVEWGERVEEFKSMEAGGGAVSDLLMKAIADAMMA